MIPTWSEFAAFLGWHPRLAACLAVAAGAAGWALHVWRLRGRERQLAILVDERTRLWQSEVAAHATLRAQVGHEAPAGTEAPTRGPGPEANRLARVLVVGEHRERRHAMSAVFADLGVLPAFADSPWAASIATRLADADGAPYDLILIDPSLEGIEAIDHPAEAVPPAGTSDGGHMIRERVEAV